ncbi:MAG: DEAD/DEAH box helicase, partial [Proteobacteria bacterium]|nr:DEAD/DEAH box helicase [Pseudomonadota bacterium]
SRSEERVHIEQGMRIGDDVDDESWGMESAWGPDDAGQPQNARKDIAYTQATVVPAKAKDIASTQAKAIPAKAREIESSLDDQTNKQPAGGKAVKLSTASKATTLSSGEEPSGQPAGSGITKQASADKTPKQPSGDETPKQASAHKTPKQPSGDEATRQTSEASTSKQSSASESTKQPAGDEAIASASAGKTSAQSAEKVTKQKSPKAAVVVLTPTSSVVDMKGVGDVLIKQLKRLKIERVIDLALHFPFRYVDYTQLTPLNLLKVGAPSAFEGEVTVSEMRQGRHSSSLFLKIEDDFGCLNIRFFRTFPSLKKKLAQGVRIRCFGIPHQYQHMLEVSHPRFEIIDPDVETLLPKFLTPVYPSTAGMAQKKLTELISNALDVLKQTNEHDYLQTIPGIPRWLMPLSGALAGVHRVKDKPTSQLILAKKHPTIKTVIFNDIFANLVALEKMSMRIRQRKCVQIRYEKSALRALNQRWPFTLTDAQKRAVDEIARDLDGKHAMLRLLQGDVGSGKTVVAAFIIYLCRLSKQQVALLAPTEILCEQHLETFASWFSPQELRVELLTSSLSRKNRDDILTRIKNHEVDLVIGTHALFQGDVEFARLALVIIDEQQRFGVEHRLQLTQGEHRDDNQVVPHQLMMTATPIPRTLATANLSILDCSVLDTMPAGRSQIKTSVMSESRREDLIERVRSYVAQNKQVFWVSPRIEIDEENPDLQSVKAVEKTLSSRIGADKVRVVHGRLKTREREKIIGDFRNKEFPILVATTVIEVGVDIPNATLMIIEHSERLGLSQIHQLRGRVGRGHKVSNCVLLYREPLSDISRARLKAAYSTDGFELARKDLELRGAGEFFGTEQSGSLNMRVGDLFRDEALLAQAHKLAKDCLNRDPTTADAVVNIWVQDADQVPL